MYASELVKYRYSDIVITTNQRSRQIRSIAWRSIIFPEGSLKAHHAESGQIDVVMKSKAWADDFRTVTGNLRELSPDRQQVKSSKC